MTDWSLFFLYYTGRVAVIAEDSVRFAHSGPSHCYLRHRCAITCYQRAPPATRREALGGMESELVPTEPSQTYPTATVVKYKEKRR